MAKKDPTTSSAADYIMPLDINGLQGRMLRMPGAKNKNREILFVYGHHSSIERWWGVIQDLHQYGTVTVPDLPGFGGMESFYKIGQAPTIDNLADYLAAFVKMRYKRKKVTIAALSFGFVVTTRMLQRYPDLVNKVDLLVSVVGFAHKDDFSFSRPRYLFYRWGAAFFSHRIPSIFFKNICLHPLVLRIAYGHTHNARAKFQELDRTTHKEMMDFETYLWHCNDLRTWMKTTVEFLTLDNCKQQIDLPVHHISVSADRYFDNYRVEQHMRVIFSKFTEYPASLDTHAPSVIADAATAAPMFPSGIRKLLSK